jgi:hypothetical protein
VQWRPDKVIRQFHQLLVITKVTVLAIGQEAEAKAFVRSISIGKKQGLVVRE